MRKLGISIYMEKSNKEEVFAYIDRAKEAGFSRIFSCLLSVTKNKEEIKKDFLEVNRYAKERGFEIFVDVSPKVFDALDISYQDLRFFKDIQADGVRLDVGYTGSEESLMTFNPYGLQIEVNMSNDTRYLETIMDYQPNPYRLVGCHNFYPHRYTGLTLPHFIRCTHNFKKQGLRTAAFVTSQVPTAFGPWPATEGLPTVEMHREMSLSAQIKHMIALGDIDDIIISNCYPSAEELTAIKNINLEVVNFNVALIDNIKEIEERIVLETLHFNRGDCNANMIRSTQSRVTYKGHDFTLFNAPTQIKRGDVLIESSLYGHYAGELQIATCDMMNSGKTNVVGHISEEELFLLDYIKPWQKFRFTKMER